MTTFRRMGRMCWAFGLVFLSMGAAADPVRVIVSIENLAPSNGTFQTPFWVGFHEGSFDTYDGGTPAGSEPQPGSVAMESLCEDGNTGPISADFAALSDGIDATLAGPAGPLAPGEAAAGTFLLDSLDPSHRYFSYVSMVIPSNDFCLSDGSPLAHPIFAPDGTFVAEDFFVTGAETLDAGTEVNDELPANTAFFGQQTPDTGVDENGVIGTVGTERPDVTGFLPRGSGGILDAAAFRMADFSLPGYPNVKISFAAAPAVTDDLDFQTEASGAHEVPPVDSRGSAAARFELREVGTVLSFAGRLRRLRDVTAAHLHLAAAGQNGPIVAVLLASGTDDNGPSKKPSKRLGGELRASDLVGPLAGRPLDALIGEILAGNVYLNVHTKSFPGGEIRGQLELE